MCQDFAHLMIARLRSLRLAAGRKVISVSVEVAPQAAE
jgi:transglutaminase-like putative cysteine protease